MYTSIDIHNITKIEVLNTLNRTDSHGDMYQTQKVLFIGRNGKRELEITAYSDGEKFGEIKTPRNVVKVGEKTYYEDELAQALANIKEVK